MIKFNNDSYDYRLVVYDNSDSGIEGTKTFNLNGGTDEYDTDNFYVTASTSYPDEDEEVDITVGARDSSNYINDSYRGTVRFKVERKS